MCGIFGYLADEIPSETCQTSLAQLRHRGPDDQGEWHNHCVFLGMRRLSIIDLAGGHQPIWNEDRTCGIVYNGELYNYLDLRPQLASRGHVFRTQSDTEVVLHAYEEWGPDCLGRFNGMFAFVIWDGRSRSLFAARDRVGEKPLYYYHDGRRLILASEIKSILADPSVPRRLHRRGLANYLAYGHAVAPETIYQGIFKLLPGHYLVTRPGLTDFRTVEYWDVGHEPPLPQAYPHLTEKEYAERVLSLLDDSVRRRMIADVPVGAFLSGGVDSSGIVALMRRHTNGRVKTFSLGFTAGGKYDELPDARRVADHLDTEHYELRIESVDLVQTLRKLVYHYDEPFGDPAGFPVYLLSRFAREHVKVILTGDGGDELFGGYVRYAVDQLAPIYGRLPGIVSRTLVPSLIGRLPRFRRLKRVALTLPIADPARRYAAWLAQFTPELQAELLSEDLRQAVADYDPAWPYPRYYHGLNGVTAADHLNRLMYIDFKTLLVDAYMEKTDKATMACSLEGRLPMLDHRLVELAFQIPGHFKIRGRSTKRILKKALSNVLPADVLKKPKRGFAVPTDPWFRGDLRSFTFDVLLDARTRRRGYFNMDVVERLWQEHTSGRHVWDGHLWLLLNFELWHRIYLDGEAV
jgi:asparagine synthase (glutamine-hydrolysing)